MKDWPFGDLPLFNYGVIYCDPAWPFENYSAKGESRNPKRHYQTLSIQQIKALPVGHLAAERCALFMWVTDPMLAEANDVMKAWGFRYATVAFTWAKRTKLDTGWHMGTGYYTRANLEMCLLGMNGRMSPVARDVRPRLPAHRHVHPKIGARHLSCGGRMETHGGDSGEILVGPNSAQNRQTSDRTSPAIRKGGSMIAAIWLRIAELRAQWTLAWKAYRWRNSPEGIIARARQDAARRGWQTRRAR